MLDLKQSLLNMSINESVAQDLELMFSNLFLEQTRKINIFSILVILLIGLIGNFLTIFVFAQKRFRTNSSNVYLLCLALVDCVFLILHLFEDTVRTYNDIYTQNDNETSLIHELIKIINITDRFEAACCLINYFRNILRLISAFIIVAFTLQRLLLVFKPFSNNFKSKKSAWYTVFLITFISFLVNSWVPFMFELKSQQDKQHCDVIDYWRREYFIITSVYIALIMLIPIVTIFLSNFLILYKTARADSVRKRLQQKANSSSQKTCETKLVNKPNHKASDSNCVRNNTLNVKKRERRISFGSVNSNSHYLSVNGHQSTFKVKPFYASTTKPVNKPIGGENSKRLKKILLLISFSYAILNFPYLVTWSIFFFQITFKNLTPASENYMFGAVQLSEIFYILNYGLKFYIYCASGTTFRNQLKKSSNLFSFLNESLF